MSDPKPIDDLTPHELRLEYLRLAGWGEVGPFTDGIVSGLRGISPYPEAGDLRIFCPDPTTSIADAMAALEGMDIYIVSKDLDGSYEAELSIYPPHGGARVNSCYSSSRLPIAITRACCAAMREVDRDV